MNKSTQEQQYLYLFVYETPIQRKQNYLHKFDDEDCAWFFVIADTKQNALFWGYELANRFIQILYDNTEITLDQIGYCGWICEDQADIQNQTGVAPVVRFGEYPPLQDIVSERYKATSWWKTRRDIARERPAAMRQYFIRASGASFPDLDPLPPQDVYISANPLGFKKIPDIWTWARHWGQLFSISPEPPGLQVSFSNMNTEDERIILTYLQKGISIPTHIVGL